MSIYDRPDELVMAESALAGEVQDFPDILRGWGITFDQTGGIPPMEWFNAIAKRTDQAIRYFMQRGLPEWSATEDYPQGAYVQYGGNAYLSKRPNTNKQPGAGGSTNDWGRWSVTRDEFNAGTVGRLLNVQVLKISGSYFAYSADVENVRIRLWAGGGGSASSPTSNQSSPGAGGGGYAEGFFPRPADGTPYTVGAGGTASAVSSATSGAGGNSSFGALLSATGGGPSATSAGGIGTGGYLQIPGGNGRGYITIAGSTSVGGMGGGSYGSAPGAIGTGPGEKGNFPGGGASAALNGYAGGQGGAGLIIVEEYA